ncbi:UDP-N-acetylmuramoyl-tripeptide--D-alanyl-D-alanine ligase [Clostridium algidicarnis]|uniref:UDP-N-acetylmuramoyl-tripeptide--D-alanyl-D-alanine ligase n=1 Tax=Clostridium algidicarnis TaxID=37659 RepID=A0ABS6C326_9CLOT|nr:UDP-N-acetylmuramoyl-tripeptide--D-alanyl-D-alanine ligase [Clostridium algidicarnis]MBB6631237.1 UDP-N-acetylmuramoyl-tripeptide--D-alanyl-D-alanine ligase [Clostridium algidicarnis]MBU3193851.1 UDP-N-acetylmuramoyl-tripeptide--D-alanyl-D-alanine ligase [Clostridium algidicarnis]MBU3219875.1 UDP-N-acetylmuramoyl-tripeptide--D-alanyl-D-alanine ligase [Clostridium algidicarnis]MCB2285658.1 UDP-N-acetylmuramoyl-tripeptide--D-alanyl-D-alanine ligase [Clostridium algidicarnis]
MIGLTLDEIIESTRGHIYLKKGEVNFSDINTDTRKIEPKSIFLALKGDNFNGNDFIEEALKKGTSLCILDEINFKKEDLLSKYNNFIIIKVENCKEALLKMAQYKREKSNIKVIGITGSTGKTTTKDMMSAVLSSKFKVFKTKGNFNNHIGLPLMILQMDESYEIAVLELGMSNLNEIHNLAEVSKPDVAVITNIGLSHIENLKSKDNILKAKMEITDFFTKDNVLIINQQDSMLSKINSKKFEIVRTSISKDKSDFKAININLKESYSEFSLIYKGKDLGRISLPVPGVHNIENALLAISCGYLMGIDIKQMVESLKALEVSSMRLDIIKGENIDIINDCYNSSPDSIKAAIDVQANLDKSRKVAILGTMKELGEYSRNAHKEIGGYAKDKGIDILVAVGEFSSEMAEGYNDEKNVFLFKNTNEAIKNINKIIRKDDLVLVKASRSMKFESIIEELKRIYN